MLQPIRSLRDNPNVFVLPNRDQQAHRKGKKPQSAILTDDTDPTNDAAGNEIDQARTQLTNAQQAQKYTSLNDFLAPEPDKPGMDNERIAQNKKLAKRAALIQAIDSIGSMAELNSGQENAAIAPSRMDNLGFSALGDLQNLDEQHQLDLRRFNQKKDAVDSQNRQFRMQADQFNKGVDVQTAQQEYDQLISEQERKDIAADDKKERHYNAALRLITQGNTREARAHLAEAGLQPDSIETIVNGGESGGSSGSGALATYGDLELTEKDRIMYNQYLRFNQMVSDEDYMINPETGKIDYTMPKPGSPAADAMQLREMMDENFYLMDHAFREQQEESKQTAHTEAQSRFQADYQQNGPSNVQPGILRNHTEMITQLTDPQAVGGAMEELHSNVIAFLKQQGVPDDNIESQADQFMDEMFADVTGGESRKPAGSGEPSQQPVMAGPGQSGPLPGLGGGVQQSEPPAEQPEPTPDVSTERTSGQGKIEEAQQPSGEQPVNGVAPGDITIADAFGQLVEGLNEVVPKGEDRGIDVKGMDRMSKRLKSRYQRLRRLENRGANQAIIDKAKAEVEKYQTIFKNMFQSMPEQQRQQVIDSTGIDPSNY